MRIAPQESTPVRTVAASATDNLEHRKKEIIRQQANCREAHRRLWSHTYLLDATKRRMHWAKRLYLDSSDEVPGR